MPPTCFNISADAPAISPLMANNLAFSKFKSLPVINSAEISLLIEFSKSNKLSDILSACSKVIPNCFALKAASANLAAVPPTDNLIASETLATSLTIVLRL